MDPGNVDALAYVAAASPADLGELDVAARAAASTGESSTSSVERSDAAGALASEPSASGSAAARAPSQAAPQPTSFCDGRYEVKRFLGEGGKKLVYLAHDAKLDRDVAFALIKTDGLLRIKREAQTMGRLGDHPHIVSVYDIGEVPYPSSVAPSPQPSPSGRGTRRGAATPGLRHRGVPRDEDAAISGAGPSPQGIAACMKCANVFCANTSTDRVHAP